MAYTAERGSSFRASVKASGFIVNIWAAILGTVLAARFLIGDSVVCCGVWWFVGWFVDVGFGFRDARLLCHVCGVSIV